MQFRKYLLPANALLLLVLVLGFTAFAGALVLSAAPASDDYGQISEVSDELNLDNQAANSEIDQPEEVVPTDDSGDLPTSMEEESSVSLFAKDTPADSIEKILGEYPNFLNNGETNPIFTYSNVNDSETNTSTIFEEVWVEMPCDTDEDGKRDLIRLQIARPKVSGEIIDPETGETKVSLSVLMEHSPYRNSHNSSLYTQVDYWNVVHDKLTNDSTEAYQYLTDVKSRKPRASKWYWGSDATYWDYDSESWTNDEDGGNPSWYITPREGVDDSAWFIPESRGDKDVVFQGNWPSTVFPIRVQSENFQYYFARGYAVVISASLGNNFQELASEGFSNCGDVEETLAAMTVIKWLNGEVKGYTDRTATTEVVATWCNGNVAMTGRSYDGTLPNATACSGVEGLKAIMPTAAISSWYDYYRGNGAVVSPYNYQGEDADMLADGSFGFGSTPAFQPHYTAVPKTGPAALYEEFLNQMHINQDRDTGDYNSFWDDRNYLTTIDDVRDDCGILIMHGLRDWNVKTKQADQFYRALKDAGKTVKEIWHLGAHATDWVKKDSNYYEYWHLWMDHFLYDLDNGAIDKIPEVSMPSNNSLNWESYDEWPIPGTEYAKYYFGAPTASKAGSLLEETPTATTIGSVKDDKEANAHLLSATVSRGIINGQLNAWEDRLFNPENIDKLSSERLVFATDPLDEPLRINGTVKIGLELLSDTSWGTISAVLLDVGTNYRAFGNSSTIENLGGYNGISNINRNNYIISNTPSEYFIVTRAYGDIQNPNPTRETYLNAPKEHGYVPAYYYQTKEIEPGEKYQYYFEFEPMDYTFKAGTRLALYVYSTDYRTTIVPVNPPTFTLYSGENTFVELPIVPSYSIFYDTNGADSQYDDLGGYSDSYPVAGQSEKTWNSGYRVVESAVGNTSVTKLTIPEGDFVGWNTEADGSGTVYKPGDRIPDDKMSDLTLYAMWGFEHEVDFDAGLGLVVVDSARTFFLDKAYGKLPTPTRSGYGFIGWFTAMTGGTMITAESIVSNDVTTLYARWTEGYQVILDVNGGNLPVGITSPITLTSASTLADLPIPTHPNEKLEFVGWKLNGKFIVESDVETGVTDTIIAGKTLVAHYSLKVKPDLGNEYLNNNVQKFPDMWDFANNVTKVAFSDDTDRVITEVVWIEVPCDVDGDGQRDLIRAEFRRPIETKSEYGGLKTPVIASATPYAQTFSSIGSLTGGKVDTDNDEGIDNPDTTDLTFDDIKCDIPTYKDLLAEGGGHMSTDLSKFGIPAPRVSVSSQKEGIAGDGMSVIAMGRTYLPLGYTAARLTIIGSTYGEGFLTYGDYSENLCVAAFVDWLNGRCNAFTNPTDKILVEPPYWATGDVFMTGGSYGGTLPFAGLITGVEGLKSIMPTSPPTSSYEYYRANGGVYAPGGWQGEDVSMIVTYCFGRGYAGTGDPAVPLSPVYGTFKPSADYPTLWDRYWAYLAECYELQDRVTGDYNTWWDERNQVGFGLEDVRDGVGIILQHGFNDNNVKFKNTALAYEMAKLINADDTPRNITAKAIFHQGMHTNVTNHNGLDLNLDLHPWIDHYLYGVENGMPDDMPDVRVQSNVDIEWKEYPTWPMGEYQKFYPTVAAATDRVGTLGFGVPAVPAQSTFKDDILFKLNRGSKGSPTIPSWVEGWDENVGKFGGEVNTMPANQFYRWRNWLLGGGETTGINTDALISAWTNPLNAPAASATVPPVPAVEFDLTVPVRDRLLYVVNVEKEMTISGTIKMTAEVAVDKKVGYMSAMLVDIGDEFRYGSGTTVTGSVKLPNGENQNLSSWTKDTSKSSARIISRGSVDIQNPNPAGLIWNDCTDTRFMAPYTWQTTAITPGTFYSYTWEMDVMEYTVLKGHQLALIIYGTDVEYTTRPLTPEKAPEYTVKIGSGTYLSLPIAAAPTITGPTSMELTVGYTATSTGVYTITGIPPATVTKVSGDAAITWNSTTKKLDIAAGLSAGTYQVVLKAANGISPDGTITFTLTVKSSDGSGTGGGSTGGDIIVGPLKPSLRNILGNDTQGATFTDVPASHWAYQYVEYLARKGFVTGKTATLYAPNDSITRAEFVTILARMEGAALSSYSGPFTDVVSGSYYAGAVDWAVKAGVTIGTSATTFSPNRTISRQEIAAMLARYVTYKLVTLVSYNQPLSFTDEAQIAAYARDYVRNMQISDIINGYPDGSFKPLANASRSEAAKMLALIHYLMSNR